MKKVLFVCTGNTCRSSMAEAIGRKIAEDRGVGGEISFKSAGIFAVDGEGASFQAMEALRDWNIDLSAHRSRRACEDLIREADIILTMTSSHRKNLISMSPSDAGKVYTLKGYAEGVEGDIGDPFGQPVDVYRKCAVELKRYIEKAVDKIIDI